MNNFKSVFICTSLLCCLMFIGCESRGNALMEVVAVDAKDLQAPVYGEHNETAEIVARERMTLLLN